MLHQQYAEEASHPISQSTTKKKRGQASHRKSEVIDDESEDGIEASDCDSALAGSATKKKDKKLVFLSRSVLKCVR